MDISKIGFYTLSNERAKRASIYSPMMRGELILSSRCNFRCPYCRSVGGEDIPLSKAKAIVNIWAKEKLQNIRFSGGEPTIYNGLEELVKLAKDKDIKRIALSTNGSASKKLYEKLINAGVNDFSISLDACCAEDGDKMAGGRKGAFDKVIDNIKWISKVCYTTVGVVLTSENVEKTEEIIKFADSLDVSDIRVIPAAQKGKELPAINVSKELLEKYPILAYRENNLKNKRPVRGNPIKRCGLVLDDIAVMGWKHYPCIIYMREGGNPIGDIKPNMRQDRYNWYINHDCTKDEICSQNCLDVCVDYNKKFEEYNKSK